MKRSVISIIISIIILLLIIVVLVPGCKGETTAEETTAKAVETTAAIEEYMPSVGKISTEDYVPTFREAKEKYLIGFANNTRAAAFCNLVEESMVESAEKAGVELFIVDNEADAAKAVDNARAMISKDVDFFVEYQPAEDANVAIADMMKQEGIPMLCIDIGAPGCPFFGGNNYLVGTKAGEWLIKYVNENWSDVEDIYFLMVEWTAAGAANDERVAGTIDSLVAAIPRIENNITKLDTDAQLETALDKTRTWLTAHPDANHIIIGTVFDGLGAGALAALRESNREADAIIMSFGADSSIFDEIRNPESAYKGSGAFFPEKYGEWVIPIALDILQGNPVPLEYFVPHVIIDGSNINEYYPAD